MLIFERSRGKPTATTNDITAPSSHTSPNSPYDQAKDDQDVVKSTAAQEDSQMEPLETDAHEKPTRSRRKQDQKDNDAKYVRMSFNLGIESANVFKALIERKGLSITEGIRRAIAIWKFFEEETSKGNQIAVIEQDGSIHKAYLL
ncbi:hypothetical protein [Actinocorallia aurantiaca]